MIRHIVKAVAVVGPAASTTSIEHAISEIFRRASERLGPGAAPQALMVVDRTGHNTVVRAMVGRMEL
jgi:flavin-binding protein dodecin